MLFDSAVGWVPRLSQTQIDDLLPTKFSRLRSYGLAIVDEVECLPFEQEATNLFFELVRPATSSLL